MILLENTLQNLPNHEGVRKEWMKKGIWILVGAQIDPISIRGSSPYRRFFPIEMISQD